MAGGCWLLLLFSLRAWAEEEGQCPAGGCGTLATYPDCEYSCNERPYIGPDSGNEEQIWPACPGGKGACRDCEDRNPSCPAFSAAYKGYGCEDNPSFMIDVCAKSCNTCHLRNMNLRCKHLMDEPEAIRSGDVNATFERLTTMPGVQAEVLSRDPWVLRLPNFLSDEEVNHLLDVEGMGLSWSSASDRGGIGADGRAEKIFSAQRSTDVAWCKHKCHSSPISKRIRARISEMVRVHPHYFESFQLLRYQHGQYYKAHHDSYTNKEPSKHRIYTFYLYLSDVAQGGETSFPKLGLKVQPTRGSAILWPSVMDNDPWQIDHRTTHEALPVVEGMKFSMNVWVHQGPYVLAHDMACSGAPID